MRNYKGQAMAIVLVLLVVGSMVGFALYTRFAQESQRTVDEKASSEANELTETVVGLISTSTYEKVTSGEVLGFLGDNCDEASLLGDGCRKSEIDLDGLEDFFNLMELTVDFSEFKLDFGADFCLSELGMRYSFEDDEVTIEQDNVYSVFVNKVDWDTCSGIDFVVTDNGGSDGFVLSTFYGEHNAENHVTSYKDYEFNDITGYHYASKPYTGSEDNWTSYASGSQIITFNKSKSTRGGNRLDEIRFKSLGGASNLRWSLDGGGCDVEGYLLMEVSATCDGQYAGKSFVLPGEVFAPPIFDYVLFNGSGKLMPDAIRIN